MQSQIQSGGEGCVFTPPEHTGAELQWIDHLTCSAAKPGGTRAKNVLRHPAAPSSLTGCETEPFQGMRRALKLGSAWYKGQCFQVTDFSPDLRQKAISADEQKHLVPTTSAHQQDIICF